MHSSRHRAVQLNAWWRVASVAALAWLGSAASFGQTPLPSAQLNSLFPAGGQQGTSVEVTVSGTDLDGLTGLHFSHAGITAVPKMIPPGDIYTQPRPIPNQLTVTIAGDVPPGRYDVRAVGKYGISNPRSFVVDTLVETVEVEPNNSLSSAQEVAFASVVNGRADPENRDYLKFTGTKGQRVLIECTAHRIDSRMDATVAIYDASGQLIDRSYDTRRRDPLLDVTLQADGQYVIELFDFVYAGGENHFYRLSITSRPYIDFVFPPSAVAGTRGNLTLFGRNLPGGVPSDVTLRGKPLERLDVQIDMPADPAAVTSPLMSQISPPEAAIDRIEYRVGPPDNLSNPVQVFLASASVVAEQEPNAHPAPQKIAAPCEIVGQFNPRGDDDWYSLDAKKGEVLWIEVFSQRLGLPTDPYLYVARVEKNEQGQEKLVDLVELDDSNAQPRQNRPNPAFDSTTADPTFRLEVPADGTYRILVRDLYSPSHGAANLIYRLAIRPTAPDFRLAVVPEAPTLDANFVGVWNPLLRKGGSVPLKVLAFRQHGFAGEIQVAVAGLPPGVTCEPTIIAPGSDVGRLVVSAAENAAPWAGTYQVIGKAKIGEHEIARSAHGGSVVWGAQNRQNEVPRSRVAQALALAVSAEETHVAAVAQAESKPWETSLAGKLEIPLKITRRGDFKGVVKLSVPVLHPNIKVAAADIPAESVDGKLTLDVQTSVPVGTYAFAVEASSQATYSRNPEHAAAEAVLSKHVEQVAAQRATEAKTAADALAAADQALQQAQAAAKAATDAFNAAKAAAEAKADDAALQAARAAAETAMNEANAKVTAANAAKTAADTAAKAAAEKVKVVEAEKAAAAKRAADAQAAANPKPANIFFYSQPITLKVTPAPIAYAAPQAPISVKQGEKLALPVNINRLYGFADQVELGLEIPAGVAGLNVPKVPIPAGQTQANLMIEATPQATAGTHQLTMRAKLTLNGQALQVDQPVALTVAPAQ